VKVAFVGAFAVRLADRVKAHLTNPCESPADEAAIASQIAEVDAVVTLAFTRQMGMGPTAQARAGAGPGLDRIAVGADGGSLVANAYVRDGHCGVRAGAMPLAAAEFGALDARAPTRHWKPVGGRSAARRMPELEGDARRPRLRDRRAWRGGFAST